MLSGKTHACSMEQRGIIVEEGVSKENMLLFSLRRDVGVVCGFLCQPTLFIGHLGILVMVTTDIFSCDEFKPDT